MSHCKAMKNSGTMESEIWEVGSGLIMIKVMVMMMMMMTEVKKFLKFIELMLR